MVKSLPAVAFRLDARKLLKAERRQAGKVTPRAALRIHRELELDQRFLLRLTQAQSPFLRTWHRGHLTTYIADLQLGRQFLAEKDDSILAATPNLAPLCPYGSLRQMTGEPHRHYRRIFVEAFRSTPIVSSDTGLKEILERMAADILRLDQPVPRQTLSAIVKRTTTEAMIRLITGIERGTPEFEKLAALYDRFTPNGMLERVEPRHLRDFAEMKPVLMRQIERCGEEQAHPSLLSYLISADAIDDTTAGNLLLMVEGGRFDLMGLWTWIVTLLGADQTVGDGIAGATAQDAVALSEAAVCETLRLEQSEFVYRYATADIVFGDIFIPKGSRIKIAVWEAHKDPQRFPDPFRFDPTRFLHGKQPADAYSPLGMDKHRCLGADWTIKLSALMLRTLVHVSHWHIEAADAPKMGRFHFEPGGSTLLRFRPRQSARG